MTSGSTARPPRHVASLFVGTGSLPFGRSRNLSQTGLFLETSARPPLGELLEINLAWGQDVLGCKARVARLAPDGIALAFLDPDTFFEQAISEILACSPPIALTPGTKTGSHS